MKYFLFDFKEATLNIASQLYIDIEKCFVKFINGLWDFFQKPIVAKTLLFLVFAYVEYLFIHALFIAGVNFPMPNIILGVCFCIILPIIAFLILEKDKA